MLTRPPISDDRLRACLRDAYGLGARELVFLPLGNDVDTAAFRVLGDDGRSYFLKLRSGPFVGATVTIPAFLHRQGLAQVIPALPTTQGRLWTRLEPFAVMLYPFVAGRNGFVAPLTDHQWLQLGAALRALHQAALPEPLLATVPGEDYAGVWRERVRSLLGAIETTSFTDEIAAEAARFLQAHQAEITQLVEGAAALAELLRTQPPPRVLCHADIHAANVLIDAAGDLFLVDWDTMILAPKERDLMFIGGGIGGVWQHEHDVTRFYQGYRETEIDRAALAYYRCERFVEDVAEYGERLLGTDLSDTDRRVGLAKFRTAFEPGNVVDIALRTEDR